MKKWILAAALCAAALPAFSRSWSCDVWQSRNYIGTFTVVQEQRDAVIIGPGFVKERARINRFRDGDVISSRTFTISTRGARGATVRVSNSMSVPRNMVGRELPCR